MQKLPDSKRSMSIKIHLDTKQKLEKRKKENNTINDVIERLLSKIS